MSPFERRKIRLGIGELWGEHQKTCRVSSNSVWSEKKGFGNLFPRNAENPNKFDDEPGIVMGLSIVEPFATAVAAAAMDDTDLRAMSKRLIGFISAEVQFILILPSFFLFKGSPLCVGYLLR